MKTAESSEVKKRNNNNNNKKSKNNESYCIWEPHAGSTHVQTEAKLNIETAERRPGHKPAYAI